MLPCHADLTIHALVLVGRTEQCQFFFTVFAEQRIGKQCDRGALRLWFERDRIDLAGSMTSFEVVDHFLVRDVAPFGD